MADGHAPADDQREAGVGVQGAAVLDVGAARRSRSSRRRRGPRRRTRCWTAGPSSPRPPRRPSARRRPRRRSRGARRAVPRCSCRPRRPPRTACRRRQSGSQPVISASAARDLRRQLAGEETQRPDGRGQPLARPAVQEGRPDRRLRRLGAAGQQAAGDPGPDVAGPGDAETGRRRSRPARAGRRGRRSTRSTPPEPDDRPRAAGEVERRRRPGRRRSRPRRRAARRRARSGSG